MKEDEIKITEDVVIPGPRPVVYIKSEKILVFADAHLGFEEEMAKHGLFLPRVQKKKLLDLLNNIFNELYVKEIVVAGDIKHQFGQLGRIEARELREVFDYLIKHVERMIIVRGNHDNFLPLITKRYENIRLVDDYYMVKDIMIIHGHKKLVLPKEKQVRLVIMGHEHPSLGLRDKLGYLIKYPCFLRVPLKEPGNIEVLILPATGVYQTGTSITLDPNAYLSPVVREKAILEEAKPIVFDEELGLLEFPELRILFSSLDEMIT